MSTLALLPRAGKSILNWTERRQTIGASVRPPVTPARISQLNPVGEMARQMTRLVSSLWILLTDWLRLAKRAFN